MSIRHTGKLVNKLCIDCSKPNKTRNKRCYKCYVLYNQNKVPKISCTCGCGEMIAGVLGNGVPAKYKYQHHKRNKKLTIEQRNKLKMVPRIFPKSFYSKIEKTINEELVKNNIMFFKHRPIKIRDSLHPIDIFIPPNICIEIDGEYFHTRLINKRYEIVRIGSLRKDYIIDYELEKMGFVVKRFWEYDIIHNLQWVMNQIFKLINVRPYKSDYLIYCKCECGQRRRPYDSKGRKRNYIIGHKNMRKDYGERICIDCKSNNTAISILKNNKKFEQWRRTNDNNFLCLSCYDKRRYIGCQNR